MPGAETIVIHGLRKRRARETRPPSRRQWTGLLEALAGRVMVAHVASIEEGFLGAALGSTASRS